MAGEWSDAPLDAVAMCTDYVANGSFASLRENVSYRSSADYAVLVRTVDFNNRWNGDYVWVDRHAYEYLSKTHLAPGDLVLSNVGSVGTVFRVPDLRQPMTLGPNAVMCRTRSAHQLDQRYLYYYFRSPDGQHSLRSITSGSAQPKFNKTDLRSLRIPLPPITEQQAIAHILGALDDKIELNRRMSETLEAIARVLFKSWFVNFDPVRAKAEGRDPGLPGPITDLFPDRFEDSELGAIPAGWHVGMLGDLLEFAYGKALKESSRSLGSVPVFGSRGQVGWHDQKLASGPGIIVGRKGNPGVVTWAQTDFFAIDTTFYVVPKATLSSPYFLFYALQAQDLASLSADSAVPGLNRNMAYLSKQIVPPQPVVKAFDDHVRLLFDRRHSVSAESETLAAIRDTLLPRLISGDLHVSRSERLLRAAVV